MNTPSILALGYAASQIPWSFIFLITQLVGVRLYSLKNREDCKRIQKRVGRCSHTTDDNKGFGYSVGYWYIMSISSENSDEGERYTIWLVATEASYAALTKGHVDTIEEKTVAKKTSLKIFDRMGSFFSPYYKHRDINIESIIARDDQAAIIASIRVHQDAHTHTVAYLHGPPGSGKSLVGVLLANAYGGSYCNTLKPWQPGDTLSALYAEVEPTKDSPLVVVFDEFDTALLRVHVGIERHKNLPIQVADKTGWNQLLDEIQLGIYPHLIVLMTSNRTPEFICSLDPSYIREGRVNIIAELA